MGRTSEKGKAHLRRNVFKKRKEGNGTMRSNFAEFYKNDEIDEIWENGRIIFDTNVLLSAYGLTMMQEISFLK